MQVEWISAAWSGKLCKSSLQMHVYTMQVTVADYAAQAVVAWSLSRSTVGRLSMMAEEEPSDLKCVPRPHPFIHYLSLALSLSLSVWCLTCGMCT